MEKNTDSTEEITVTRKVSREYARQAAEYGLDLKELLTADLKDPSVKHYQVGRGKHIITIPVYDASLIAYFYGEKIQSIVDSYADEATKQKDPEDFVLTKMDGLYKAISYVNSPSEMEYAGRALSYIKHHLDMIEPRPVRIIVNLLWEGEDGKYYKNL